jgi:hypothetical protein
VLNPCKSCASDKHSSEHEENTGTDSKRQIDITCISVEGREMVKEIFSFHGPRIPAIANAKSVDDPFRTPITDEEVPSKFVTGF